MPVAEDMKLLTGQTVTITLSPEGEVDLDSLTANLVEKIKEQKQKIAEQQKRIKIILLLDASGSMASRASDVIGGVNTYLETLRTDGNTYDVSLYLFNDKLTPVFTDISLTEVSTTIIAETYYTQGSTAFYDSLKQVLDITREAWKLPLHPYGVSPTFCIIDTDGEENSSVHTAKEHIVASIKRREEAGNWTFVYMGADQDAWSLAAGIGLAQGNVVSYSGRQTKGMYQRLATATSTASGTASTGGPIQTRTFFTLTPTPSGTNSHISSSILIDTSDKN